VVAWDEGAAACSAVSDWRSFLAMPPLSPGWGAPAKDLLLLLLLLTLVDFLLTKGGVLWPA